MYTRAALLQSRPVQRLPDAWPAVQRSNRAQLRAGGCGLVQNLGQQAGSWAVPGRHPHGAGLQLQPCGPAETAAAAPQGTLSWRVVLMVQLPRQLAPAAAAGRWLPRGWVPHGLGTVGLWGGQPRAPAAAAAAAAQSRQAHRAIGPWRVAQLLPAAQSRSAQRQVRWQALQQGFHRNREAALVMRQETWVGPLLQPQSGLLQSNAR